MAIIRGVILYAQREIEWLREGADKLEHYSISGHGDAELKKDWAESALFKRALANTMESVLAAHNKGDK